MAGRCRYVIVDEKDNAATVIEPIEKGEVLETEKGRITLLKKQSLRGTNSRALGHKCKYIIPVSVFDCIAGI